MYPLSLANVVRYAHRASGVPVIVTEHGVNAAKAVIDEGVPVKGYCRWSLIDNFEWVFGYKPQSGLHALDRTTFRRTARPSAAVLGRIARANGV